MRSSQSAPSSVDSMSRVGSYCDGSRGQRDDGNGRRGGSVISIELSVDGEVYARQQS